MDVLVGSSSAATASCLFLNQNGAGGGGGGSGGGAFGGGRSKALSDDSLSSTSSSSIGAPDVSDEENESKDGSGDVTDGEEVQSKFTGGGKMSSLGSLGSLEDSLPINRRGLSNYFSGKSKSFQSLSDVVTTASTVKELEKRDNPFNKRRRVLIASKWSRKSSSFYTMPNPKSMPLLTLNENEHEDEDDEEPEETQEDPSSDQSSSDEKEDRHIMIRTPKLLDRGLKSFKSRSCYCLSDLQEHEH